MTREGHFFMETYIELTIENIGQEQSHFLIASLDAIGYTGFLEESNCLKAYVPVSAFQPLLVNELCAQLACVYTTKTIPPSNWNESWETSFNPVRVENFAAIRATFHTPVSNVQHEILINPKMSFGTGHHATTYLMIQQMQRLDLKNKRVFDFGTGTGVLSVLASKMGAASVFAIDNDVWSIENASENFQLNKTVAIELQLAEYPPDMQFDGILANINRSVLLKFIPALSNSLVPSGFLIVSGFLKEDKELLLEAATYTKLKLCNVLNKEGWLSILFYKMA
jgi:ribosomal protein L11 methyltransferase